MAGLPSGPSGSVTSHTPHLSRESQVLPCQLLKLQRGGREQH